MAGRNTYDDSDGFGGSGGPHPTAPLIVVSHRPAPPEATDKQTFVTSIEAGIEAARAVAGDQDVAVMGGGATTAALRAGLLDEVILHQVPVLLGAGRRFFGDLPAHIELDSGGGRARAWSHPPALPDRGKACLNLTCAVCSAPLPWRISPRSSRTGRRTPSRSSSVPRATGSRSLLAPRP